MYLVVQYHVCVMYCNVSMSTYQLSLCNKLRNAPPIFILAYVDKARRTCKTHLQFNVANVLCLLFGPIKLMGTENVSEFLQLWVSSCLAWAHCIIFHLWYVLHNYEYCTYTCNYISFCILRFHWPRTGHVDDNQFWYIQ